MGGVIKAKEIADFLESTLEGKNFSVVGVCSFSELREGKLSFTKQRKADIPAKEALVIVPDYFIVNELEKAAIIRVRNPRLAFAKIVANFFSLRPDFFGIHDSVVFGNDVIIGQNVTVGPNVTIENNVTLGNNVYIHPNVVIHSNSIVGDNSEIKSGSIIGAEGFGYDFEENGTPVKIPHIGRVVLGNNVQIGALCTIDRGTIDDTVLNDHVKTGQRVHIAHNCSIGENTVIAASASISGSTSIGKDCWIGASSSIINHAVIEDEAMVGFGAVVIKKVEKNTVVVGNPAKYLRDRKE